MPKRLIDDVDQFKAFLATQPLCRWAAQKQHDVATGKISDKAQGLHIGAAKKDDNADLMAALSSMA